MENTPLKNNDNVTVVPVLAKKKYDFTNIVFFKSPKNGTTVGQISIMGRDCIILVPDKLRKGIKRGLSYNVQCHKLQKGTGFVLEKYELYVPTTQIVLSSDRRNVAVIHGVVPTSYSYDLSGPMTPREFYEAKKFNFNAEIRTPSALLKWKAALQQISQHWEDLAGEWDEYVTTSSVKPLEQLQEEPVYNPSWEIDGVDELVEK